MKRNISDLLDCLDYSPLQTKTADIVSAERIKELTMNTITHNSAKISPARRQGMTWRKSFAAILAAATLILALCGVAYASNAFGIREHFRGLFAGGQYEISPGDLEILENIGAEEMPSVTSNGTTMTVTAAVYEGGIDHFAYYLALKITAPEGTVLDRGESFWQLWSYEEMLSLEYADGEPLGGGRNIGTKFSDDTPGDNEITVIVEFMTDGVTFGDGRAKILTIPGLWLQSPDKEYTRILDGEWVFDLEQCGVPGPMHGVASEPNTAPAGDTRDDSYYSGLEEGYDADKDAGLTPPVWDDTDEVLPTPMVG